MTDQAFPSSLKSMVDTNPPRAFDLNEPGEQRRLWREVLGYLNTCKRQHHGTDFEGRGFAERAVRQLHDMGMLLSPPIAGEPTDAEAERVARAFEPHLWSRIDRDLNVEHLTGAATHARTNSMDRARAAIIALRGGE